MLTHRFANLLESSSEDRSSVALLTESRLPSDSASFVPCPISFWSALPVPQQMAMAEIYRLAYLQAQKCMQPEPSVRYYRYSNN